MAQQAAPEESCAVRAELAISAISVRAELAISAISVRVELAISRAGTLRG